MQVVKFLRGWSLYNAGERASVGDAIAANLIRDGVAEAIAPKVATPNVEPVAQRPASEDAVVSEPPVRRRRKRANRVQADQQED